MIKNKLQSITAAFIATIALAAPFSVNAADSTTSNAPSNPTAKAVASPAAKAEKPAAVKVASLPYKGHVVAVDKTAKTFSLGKKDVRVFSISDKTKVTKGDAVATLADLAVGDKVTGAYVKTADGKFEATSLKIGSDVAKASRKDAKTAPVAAPKA